MPADDFGSVFAVPKPVLKTPSPLPQHKGQPMFFGSLRLGKA